MSLWRKLFWGVVGIEVQGDAQVRKVSTVEGLQHGYDCIIAMTMLDVTVV